MRMPVAVMLCVLAVSLPAHAVSSSEAKSMTIRLVSVTTKTKVLVDRPPTKTFNIGDVLWSKSTLRNEVAQFGRPKGAIVGGDVATLEVISNSKGDVKVTAKLPGGTLRAAGRVGSGLSASIPVVGGTGAFAGARGVAESSPLSPGSDRERNVYRLQLP